MHRLILTRETDQCPLLEGPRLGEPDRDVITERVLLEGMSRAAVLGSMGEYRVFISLG